MEKSSAGMTILTNKYEKYFFFNNKGALTCRHFATYAVNLYAKCGIHCIFD